MRTSWMGCRWTALLFIGMIFVASSAQAIDLGPGQPCAAIKWGRTGRGSGEVKNVDDGSSEFSLKSGSSFGIAFDYPLGRYLSTGIDVDWWFIKGSHWPELNLTANSLGGIELGTHLKGLISLYNGRFAIRPGFGIGGFQSHYTILALRAGVEWQASFSDRFGIGVETGTWYAPIGTDDKHDISLGPLGFVRLQLLIATGSSKPNN
jgi:hypothetical protein